MSYDLSLQDEGKARREEIYAAAVALFRQKGYHATSTRDIAAVVGIQTSTLYYYYASKEALLFDIMERFLTDLLRVVEDHIQDISDPVKALHTAVFFHVKFHGMRSLEAVVSDTEVRALQGPYREKIMSLRDTYEALFRYLLQRGVDSGCMRPMDVKVAARALLGMATSVVTWFRPDGPLPLDVIAAEHADMAIRGVAMESRA